ncbi:LysR family transcriptional regulator [Amycolatopsis endophytica]|uniref:DNA-binding transcriptional LysR family regulator n=1 Tax=Amycolatopsis endophytica TaxID=860233 RepID=A0A853B973_9PSEU|nr:LysR family transcriptional regulator [Amycolatopsis endophytica]NYI91345.1 DNA-binding transcriptional LysR family regulator [Amycolatopsis endophytica]
MTRLPDIESLRLLVLVGSHGSLTAAAEATGISQPSASKRMSSFERSLGLQLLDRSRRGSTLTSTGRLVSGWAERVLDEMAVMLEGVDALRREHTAQLSLAASLTVAEHLLPTWIGELRRSSPDLHVGLQVMNSNRVHELARQAEIDMGFVESPGRLAGVHSRVVARDRLVLVVSREHKWSRRQRPIGPAELAATPLISRETGSGTRDTAERALLAAGFTPVPPLIELGSATAVRSAVAAGAGPALISELIVRGDLASGGLTRVPTADIDLARTLRAVWSSRRRPTGPAGQLLSIALRGAVPAF